VFLTHLHADHIGDLPGMLLYGWGVRVGDGRLPAPVTVMEDDAVRVTAITVTHGHVMPMFAYRFDTADGSVVFSGDTTANAGLIALAQGADILVHQVADLGYLERARGHR
jgi:ribonuclease BN (tRNA processing enzyme)